MNLTLRRDDQDSVRTLGKMFTEDGVWICETLELPWRDNKRGVSCIPEGFYECKMAHSPSRGYPVYWLQDVPGRQDVQIHIGNFTKDIRGCILVGSDRGENMVLRSKMAFKAFMAKMDGRDFTLVVEKA